MQRRKVIFKALLFAAGLVVLAPGLAAKERRGHDVIVAKTDGTTCSGELLAVKGADLLIMERTTLAGITVNLADVRAVKVVKDSKFLKGLVMGGLVIGAPVGALFGLAAHPKGYVLSRWNEWSDPAQAAVGGAVLFGGVGALIGGTAGGLSGIDKDIKVEPSSPTRLAEVARQLRPYARERS
jgi:hypothetical protein